MISQLILVGLICLIFIHLCNRIDSLNRTLYKLSNLYSILFYIFDTKVCLNQIKVMLGGPLFIFALTVRIPQGNARV